MANRDSDADGDCCHFVADSVADSIADVYPDGDCCHFVADNVAGSVADSDANGNAGSDADSHCIPYGDFSPCDSYPVPDRNAQPDRVGDCDAQRNFDGICDGNRFGDLDTIAH